MNSPFTSYTGQDFETVSNKNFVSNNEMAGSTFLETPFMSEELEEDFYEETLTQDIDEEELLSEDAGNTEWEEYNNYEEESRYYDYLPEPTVSEFESPLINPVATEVNYRNACTIEKQEVPSINSFFSELEEEIIGKDERILIKDTLQIPNQWVCSIEVLIDNPKWGSGAQQYIVSGRGTGILIGPRYVLTARHVVESAQIDVEGKRKIVHVKGVTVSPARNGSNSSNPFGMIKSKAIHLSTAYRIHPKRPDTAMDDYALIVLEKDIADNSHSGMKAALGYWGQHQGIAVIKRLALDKLQGKEITLIGYPGDRCGKDIISGSEAEKLRGIKWCQDQQKDKWASTQWRSLGKLKVDINSTRLFHTADSYEGESGAPLCLRSEGKLYLVGLHTSPSDQSYNKGVRVSRRMLRELCTWINADAGYIMATIKDDTLVVQPRSGARTGKISSENETKAENFFELFESPHATAQDENFEISGHTQAEAFDPVYTSGEDMPAIAGEGLYEFDVSTPSPAITDALNKKDWTLALQLAIKEGWRDENNLTNLLFFARHTELPIERIDPKHPKFRQLSGEWSNIFNNEVLKAIQASAERIDLAVSGEEASEHHKYFRGKNGKKLKQLIEEVAKEVNINPGLLATTMIVESGGRTYIFLLNEKVKSYHVGVDDFYEARAGLKARVPAYDKVGWDKSQKPEEHYNDAKTDQRIVKTIQFNTGRDAAFAIAVYLKYFEIRLHEESAKLKGDFDKLPLETRLALNRMAMASGMGGVLPRLTAALAGKDIFIRKAIPVVIYQTQRNATVRIAQAMYLDEWVFGIFVKPTTQPELEAFEEFDQEAYYGFNNESIEGSLQYNVNENTAFKHLDREEETRSYLQVATRFANAYLTLTGQKQGTIKGSVTQKGKEGSIAVYQVHHEIIAPRDVATGMASGRRVHKPLVITKEIDASSVKLLSALTTNENLKQVIINFWQPGTTGARGSAAGIEINYYRITLTNARITDIAQDMPNVLNPAETKYPFLEKVEFTYQKIEWEYLANNPGMASDDAYTQSETTYNEAIGEAEWEESESAGKDEMDRLTYQFSDWETEDISTNWANAANQNRYYANKLGWNQYYDQINNLLLPYSGLQGVSLGEESLAQAAAAWQQQQGLIADGIIGPVSWKAMQALLGAGSYIPLPPPPVNTPPGSVAPSPANILQFNQYHAQKVLNAMNNGILGTNFDSKTQLETIVNGQLVKKVDPVNQLVLILPIMSHIAEQATTNNYRDIIIGSFIRDPESNGSCTGHCTGSRIDINYKGGGFTTAGSVQMVIRILQWLLLMPSQNRQNLGFGMPLQGMFFGSQPLAKFHSVSPNLLGDQTLKQLVPQLGFVFPDNDNHLHIQVK